MAQPGDNCSSACFTKDHLTWGECVRDKGLKHAVSIPGNGHDRSVQKSWDSELDLYRTARSQGIQPAGTKRPQIERAIEISEKTGQAYNAG